MKKKDKLFKTQNQHTKENLEIYCSNLSCKVQNCTSPSCKSISKRMHNENTCSNVPCKFITCKNNPSNTSMHVEDTCTISPCKFISCKNNPQSCKVSPDTEGSSGTSSSDVTSRMRNLSNYTEEPRSKRFTGTHSHSSLDWSRNPGVPDDFWEKHTWADKTNHMCDPKEMDYWITKEKLEHVYDEIAPWFTTAWPINLFDRRYWTYHHTDGTTWVSRTLAQSKNFYLRGKPMDPCDRCVICYKLLLSEYHVYMPVYMFEENPSKVQVWQWQDSRDKALLNDLVPQDPLQTLHRWPQIPQELHSS